MNGFLISEVNCGVVKSKIGETDEINIGHNKYDRFFFSISYGGSVAYAVVYSIDNGSVELARFFVPKEFRGVGFGRDAAVAFIKYLFENNSEILIDSIAGGSFNFWCKVYEKFGCCLNLEEIGEEKNIWRKNLACICNG